MNRSTYRQPRRLSSSELRTRRQDRLGLALCGAVMLAFGGMCYGAARIDASNGITPAESMCNNGFSGFCAAPAEALPESGFYSSREFCDSRDCGAYLKAKRLARYEATEARLIGRCDGRLMAGTEEDSFPAGCDWIEPIREGGR